MTITEWKEKAKHILQTKKLSDEGWDEVLDGLLFVSETEGLLILDEMVENA